MADWDLLAMTQHQMKTEMLFSEELVTDFSRSSRMGLLATNTTAVVIRAKNAAMVLTGIGS
jgi:TolB-like protein